MSVDAKCIACGAPALPGLANLVPCGENTYICPDCAGAATRCFEARGSPPKQGTATTRETSKIPTPTELVAALDRVVIGQAEAKRLLSVSMWKHLQRCNGNTSVPPAHVLLFGPTGCGKTHLVRTMAKLMDVPFVVEDSTTFSEAGYKGRDVREVLKDVVNAAGGDLERGKHAVVFFDEFDKLCATESEAREAYQYGTQHGFLTLLDGIFDGSGINPGGLLFVFAGAFPKLGEIIESRMGCNKTTRPVGFGHAYSVSLTACHPANLLASATAEDFVTYGLEAELMGRIPVLAPLLPLTEDELVRILTKPEGSVCSQYTAFFSKLGVEFTLAPEAAQLLAHEAHTSGSGARGLKGRLERAITDMLFCCPKSNTLHITADILREEGQDYGTVASA